MVGIPCQHEIALISWKRERQEDYCREWLTLDSYNATCEHFTKPTQGQEGSNIL